MAYIAQWRVIAAVFVRSATRGWTTHGNCAPSQHAIEVYPRRSLKVAKEAMDVVRNDVVVSRDERKT